MVEGIATHNMVHVLNVPVKPSIKYKHNYPIIVIWDREKALHAVVDIHYTIERNIKPLISKNENIMGKSTVRVSILQVSLIIWALWCEKHRLNIRLGKLVSSE